MNSPTIVQRPVDGPKISVVTPVYNGAAYLDELIRSVTAQTYPHFEHIIIDDGSRDDGATLEVLRKYPHLRWWTRPNKGQYATLNEGMEAATGDLLCIISADDAFSSPDVFSSVAEAWAREPAVDGIYGRTTLMDRSGASVAERHGRPDESYPLWMNRHFLLIHHCSLFISLPFVRRCGLSFDTSLRYTGDWDWINRIIQQGRLRFVDQPFSKYRIHPEQTRQATARSQLVQEDRLVLSRYGSSYFKHTLLVNFFRAKKLFLMLLRDGPTAVHAGLRRYLQRQRT